MTAAAAAVGYGIWKRLDGGVDWWYLKIVFGDRVESCQIETNEGGRPFFIFV